MTNALVALASKVSTSVPALFVVTVPIVVPPTTRLPPSVSALRVPVAEKTSSPLVPPLRTRVSVAPAKLLASVSSWS